MESSYSFVHLKEIPTHNNSKLTCIGILSRPDSIIFRDSAGEFHSYSFNCNDELKKLDVLKGCKLFINDQRGELSLVTDNYFCSRKISSDYHFLGGEVVPSSENDNTSSIDPLLAKIIPEEIILKQEDNGIIKFLVKHGSLFELQRRYQNLDQYPEKFQTVFHILNTTQLDDDDIIMAIFKRSELVMHVEIMRWLTLGHWPHNFPFTKPKNLANSGFFDSYSFDRVNCFHCGTNLVSWEESDEPLTEHKRHYSQCAFISTEKGPIFTLNMSNSDFFLNRPFRYTPRRIKYVGSSENSTLFLPTVTDDNLIVIWDVSSFIRVALEFRIDSYLPAKDYLVKLIKLTALPSSYEEISISDDEQFNNREKITSLGFPYLCSIIAETNEGFLLFFMLKLHLNTLSNCVYLLSEMSYKSIMKNHLMMPSHKSISVKSEISDFSDFGRENFKDCSYDEDLIINDKEDEIQKPQSEVISLLSFEYIHDHGSEIDLNVKYFPKTCESLKISNQSTMNTDTFDKEMKNVRIFLSSYGYCEKTMSNGFIKVLRCTEKTLDNLLKIIIPKELPLKDLNFVNHSDQSDTITYLALIEGKLSMFQLGEQQENGSFTLTISYPSVTKKNGSTIEDLCEKIVDFKLSSSYLYLQHASGKRSIFKCIADHIQQKILYQCQDLRLVQELPKSFDTISVDNGNAGRALISLGEMSVYLPRIFLTSHLNQLQWSVKLCNNIELIELIEKLNLIDPTEEEGPLTAFKGPINHLNRLIAAQSLSHVDLMKLAFIAFARGSRLWAIPKNEANMGNLENDVTFQLKIFEQIPIACVNVHLHLVDDPIFLPDRRITIVMSMYIEDEIETKAVLTKSIRPFDHVGKIISFDLYLPDLVQLLPGKIVHVNFLVNNETKYPESGIRCFRYIELNLECFSGFLRQRNKYICNQELFLPQNLRCDERFAKTSRHTLLNTHEIQANLCETLLDNLSRDIFSSKLKAISWLLNNLLAIENINQVERLMVILSNRLDLIVEILLTETDQTNIKVISEFFSCLMNIHRRHLAGGDQSHEENFIKHLHLTEPDNLRSKLIQLKSVSRMGTQRLFDIITESVGIFMTRWGADNKFIERYIHLVHTILNGPLGREVTSKSLATCTGNERPLKVQYAQTSVTLRSHYETSRDPKDSLYYLHLCNLTPGRIFDIYIPMINVDRIYRATFKTQPFIVGLAFQLRFNNNKDHFVEFIIPEKDCQQSTIEINNWPFFEDKIFCGVHLIVAVHLDNLPSEISMHLGQYFGVDVAESLEDEISQYSCKIGDREMLHLSNRVIEETLKDIPTSITYKDKAGLLLTFAKISNVPLKMSIVGTMEKLTISFLMEDLDFLNHFLDASLEDDLLLTKIFQPILDQCLRDRNRILLILEGIIEYIRNYSDKMVTNLLRVINKSLEEAKIFNPDMVNEDNLLDLRLDQELQGNLLSIFKSMIDQLDKETLPYQNLYFIMNIFPMFKENIFDFLPTPKVDNFIAHRGFFKVLFHLLTNLSDTHSLHLSKMKFNGIDYLDKCMTAYFLERKYASLETLLGVLFEIFSDEPEENFLRRSKLFSNIEIATDILSVFNEEEMDELRPLLSQTMVFHSIKFISAHIKVHDKSQPVITEKLLPIWLQYLLNNTISLSYESSSLVQFYYPKYLAIIRFLFETSSLDVLREIYARMLSQSLIGLNDDISTMFMYFYSLNIMKNTLQVPEYNDDDLGTALTQIYQSSDAGASLNLILYELDKTIYPFRYEKNDLVLTKLFNMHGAYLRFCCLMICFLHTNIDSDKSYSQRLVRLFERIIGKLRLSDSFIVNFFEAIILHSEITKDDDPPFQFASTDSIDILSLFEGCILKMNILTTSSFPAKGHDCISETLFYFRYKSLGKSPLNEMEHEKIINLLNNQRTTRVVTTDSFELGPLVNLTKDCRLSSEIEKAKICAIEECIDAKKSYSFIPDATLLTCPRLILTFKEMQVVTEVKIKLSSQVYNELSERISVDLYRSANGERTHLNVPVIKSSVNNFIYIEFLLDSTKNLPMANELIISWTSLRYPIHKSGSIESIAIYGAKDFKKASLIALEKYSGPEKNRLIAYHLLILARNSIKSKLQLRPEMKQIHLKLLARLILTDDSHKHPVSLAILNYLRDNFANALSMIKTQLVASGQNYIDHLTISLVIYLTRTLLTFQPIELIESIFNDAYESTHNPLISKLHDSILRPSGSYQKRTRNSDNLTKLLNLTRGSPAYDKYLTNKNLEHFMELFNKSKVDEPLETSLTLVNLVTNVTHAFSHHDDPRQLKLIQLVYLDLPRENSQLVKNILSIFSTYHYDILRIVPKLFALNSIKNISIDLLKDFIANLPLLFVHCENFSRTECKDLVNFVQPAKDFLINSGGEMSAFLVKFLISLAIGVDMRRTTLSDLALEQVESLLLDFIEVIHQEFLENFEASMFHLIRLLSRSHLESTFERITKVLDNYLGKQSNKKTSQILHFLKDFIAPCKVTFQLHFIKGYNEGKSSPGISINDPNVTMANKDLYSLKYLDEVIVLNETFDFTCSSSDYQTKKFLINPRNLFVRNNESFFKETFDALTKPARSPREILSIYALKFYRNEIHNLFLECDLTPALWSTENRLFDYIYSSLARDIVQQPQREVFQQFCPQQNSLSMFSLFSFIFFIQSETYIRQMKRKFPEFYPVYFEAFNALLLTKYSDSCNNISAMPDSGKDVNDNESMICNIYRKIATKISGDNFNVLVLPFEAFFLFTRSVNLAPFDVNLICKSNVFLIGLLSVLDLKKKFILSSLPDDHTFYGYTQLCQTILHDEMNKRHGVNEETRRGQSMNALQDHDISHLNYHHGSPMIIKDPENILTGFSKGTGYSMSGYYENVNQQKIINESNNLAVEIRKRDLIFTICLKCIRFSINCFSDENVNLPQDILMGEFMTPLMEILTPVIMSESIDDMANRKRVYSHTLGILQGLVSLPKLKYILFSVPNEIPISFDDFISTNSLEHSFAEFVDKNERTVCGILYRIDKFLNSFIHSLEKISDRGKGDDIHLDETRRHVPCNLQRKNSIRIKDLRVLRNLNRSSKKILKPLPETDEIKDFIFQRDEIQHILSDTLKPKPQKQKDFHREQIKSVEDPLFIVVPSLHKVVVNLLKSLEISYDEIQIQFQKTLKSTENSLITPQQQSLTHDDDSFSAKTKYVQELKKLQCVYREFLEPVPEKMDAFKLKIHHNFARDSLRQSGLKLEDYLQKTANDTERFESVNAKVSIRLAKEILTMTKNLPLSWETGIFLSIDETRNDLIKALITGPADTPYSNGCFEFDIFADATYPSNPPKFYFVTTGDLTVRFNPNLYENGKICLSLLNTWQSTPEERWQPGTSNLMQVLISIQSMIFVPEPYFNEPGYQVDRGSIPGDLASKSYNENIEIQTMKWAILNQLENPPKAFCDVVKKHFEIKRSEVIDVVHKWIENSTNSNHRNTLKSFLKKFEDLVQEI